VTRDDIERLLHDIAEGKSRAKIKTKLHGLALVKGGKTAANRTVGLLGAIFGYAVRRGMRSDNPVRGVQFFADRRRERRLANEEYGALGNALHEAERGMWPPAIAITRFAAITGWRRGEVLALRWADLDLDRRMAILGDTKTGRSIRPLSHTACELLLSLERTGDLVFPATRGNGQLTGFRKFWLKIAKLGHLPSDITPHVLRHSFASVAGDLGYSDATIAALVGHKGRTVTSRYVHAADAVLLAASDAVANHISTLMGDKRLAGQVIQMRRDGGLVKFVRKDQQVPNPSLDRKC
jgi:integrase